VKRPDNGLLSGTSGRPAWRGSENGREAVCDSGTLSGTSAEEEMRRRVRVRAKPDVIYGPRR
jgi:hypothetical protein